jgi:hypothetical protein
MFRHLSSLRSFDSPKGPLVHKQTSFPITFGGIEIISTSTMTPTTYLKSWAFVVSIIVAKFMVDQCLFLLKALARVNNDTFPFKQHLKATCDLLSPASCACFFPFKQFIKQQMVQFQNSILEYLHYHTLSNMLFNGIFEVHHAQIFSCSSPRVGA